MLNFNNLTDIKDGWLPDNLPEVNIEEIKEEKIKQLDPLLKRKRGRPKKIEIFKSDLIKGEEVMISISERDILMKTDLTSPDDMHYDFCGRCSEFGKLICCETCSSAYHYECLGYEKFPRGKFKCYYCKIVKVGIDEAISVDKLSAKLIKKLITYNRKAKWQSKAQELLDVINDHHCSAFFKSPVPQDFLEYYEKIKETMDLTLVEIKLNHKKFGSLREFIADVYLIWSNFKEFYTPASFFYKQANTLEMFMTHLIKEESVFDTFEPEYLGIASLGGSACKVENVNENENENNDGKDDKVKSEELDNGNTDNDNDIEIFLDK